MDQVLMLMGLALIAGGLLQFGLWTGRGVRLRQMDRAKFKTELELLHAELYKIRNARNAESARVIDEVLHSGISNNRDSWTDFRPFHVARLHKETDNCTSVYLVPADGRPIPDYLPGQHLTLRFAAGEGAVRCYTLSDTWRPDSYRISVKKCVAPPDHPDAPPGLVSHYVNDQLKVGDVVEVKPPSGKFFLEPGTDPIVMLAGGIGITPMLSMMNYLAATGSTRPCLLVHGVRDGSDHAFKLQLSELAANHENLHVVYCYSSPGGQELAGTDFHVSGLVTVDLLKRILPGRVCDFYMCGPPAFMQSIYRGLRDWGVEDTRIRYEAFGPASVQRDGQGNERPDAVNASITLARSGRTLDWDSQFDSLLDLLEAHNIPVDSGCRAGSCETCELKLLKGNVTYPDADQIECQPGHCLPCMAVPAEPIELDV